MSFLIFVSGDVSTSSKFGACLVEAAPSLQDLSLACRTQLVEWMALIDCLVGGFNFFLFSPRNLGKIPIFFRWVETTN